MRNIVTILLLFFTSLAFSQEYTLKDLEPKKMDNFIRLNYMTVHQPVDLVSYDLAPKMGFIGLTYNIPLNDWLYAGAGFHTAITGDQGGLFTLGATLGVTKEIIDHFYVDANVHFGGGGGYRSLVNGGGILYPNAGIAYKKNGYALGIQYGYMNFFTGIQKDDNVSFFIQIPTLLRTASYEKAQKEFFNTGNTGEKIWKKPAVKSVQQVTFDYLFPVGRSRTDASTNPPYQPIENTLSLLGFEYQRYLTPNTFIYAHVDAMHDGLVAGFMDLFFGVGKNFIETKYINFFAKMGVGAAGGRIFPENGATMYPSAGFDIRFSEKLGLSTHVGYHRSIGASFEAYTAGFSLKYYGLSGGIETPFTEEKVTSIKTKGIQLGIQNQTYFDVAKFGIPDSDLQLIAIRVLYDLNKRFYLSGEASFAYEGESGGYAHGIFGLGIRSNRFLGNKISVFSEMNAGVAGGGRVDSGKGILLRPNIGINYHHNSALSFNISAGQIWSPFGNVNSSNINIGLTYALSLLNSKK